MYLRDNNTTLFEAKQSSNLSSIIDYFSAPNLLDTFNLNGDFTYNNQLQIFQEKVTLINESNLHDIQSWDQVFNLNFIDYRNLLSIDKLDNLQPLTNYISDLTLVTPEHNNVNALIEFFPESTMHFENFELSNLEPDEGVFEALSTPDLKIFYPEPFIASPSFVHEDL